MGLLSKWWVRPRGPDPGHIASYGSNLRGEHDEQPACIKHMPSKAAQMEIRRVDTHEEEHAGESYAANADFGMPAAIGMFYRRREALSVVLD